MNDLEFRVAELERQVKGLIRYATIKTQDGDRVTVKDGKLETGAIPFLAHRAGPDRDWWAPEPGEQVVLLCPCGDPNLGIALPSVYRDLYPAPAGSADVRKTVFKDNAVFQYDRSASKLTINIPEAIDITAPDMKFTGATVFDGSVHATEPITSDKSIGAPDMEAGGSISAPSIKADGAELAHHDHECPHGGRTSELGE
ncbi:MAG: phage baseplate assembly protein V [Desulfobacterales bacterium]|nr:phage baseplate assembly protein V [Desulfobacterales bacterium]